MVSAIIFWALAMYGALVLVWQSSKRLQRKLQNPHPIIFVLVVQNAAVEIEGILRTAIVKTAFAVRERRILVLDLASTDETEAIVQRLARHHGCLDYARVDSEFEGWQALKDLCFGPQRVGCVYDLRVHGMRHDIAEDIASLCQ